MRSLREDLRARVAVHADGPLAVECLTRALRGYELRERPNFVLEAALPDSAQRSISTLLSIVSRCLTDYGLEALTIEVADRTYLLSG